jgi:hypothetical protein
MEAMTLRMDFPEGEYQQSGLSRSKQLRDEDVPQFCRYWLSGKVPKWIARHFRTPAGNLLHWRMAYSHAQRLERQGFLPQGSGAKPCRWEERHRWAEIERATVYTRNRVVIERTELLPGVKIRPDNRGRPKGRRDDAPEVKKMAEPFRGMASIEERLARERAENRRTMAGIEPDAAQLAPRRPVAIEPDPSARAQLDSLARSRDTTLAAHHAQYWEERAALTPSPASDGTTAGNEDRIRPRGAEPERLIHAIKLPGAPIQPLRVHDDQEEGTTDASEEGRTADPTRDQDDLEPIHGTGARQADTQPDRARTRRRGPGAAPARKRKDRRDHSNETEPTEPAESYDDGNTERRE